VNLDLLFYREIDRLVSELLDKMGDELAAGKAISHKDYRYRVGRMRGLVDAMTIVKEVHDRMTGAEDKSGSH
jgi:hypothetical protein